MPIKSKRTNIQNLYTSINVLKIKKKIILRCPIFSLMATGMFLAIASWRSHNTIISQNLRSQSARDLQLDDSDRQSHCCPVLFINHAVLIIMHLVLMFDITIFVRINISR